MKIRTAVIVAIILIILSVFFTSLYFTHKQQDMTKEQAKALLNLATNNSVKILKSFPAVGNLQGFVVTSNKRHTQKGIVYVNKRYRYVISGVLINSQGKNIVEQDFNKYIEPASAVKAFKAIDTTHYVSQGKSDAPHKAYVVVDPNCIFCHKLYEKLQPMIKKGQLAVRWIIVGMIKPSSKAKAAAILSASNPDKALAKNEQGFNEQREEGGIQPLKNPSEKIKQALQDNMDFMMKNQITATPVILYRTSDNVLKMETGLPQGKAFDAMIKQMGSQF